MSAKDLDYVTGLLAGFKDPMPEPDPARTPDEQYVEAAQRAIRRYRINQELMDLEAQQGLPMPHRVLQEMDPTQHLLTPYLDHIERMSWQGMRFDQIADRLGLDHKILGAAMAKRADVKAALLGGKARAADDLTAITMHDAMHNPVAALNILKLKHGYDERPKDGGAPAALVQVNVGNQAAPVPYQHADRLAQNQAALLAAGPSTEPDPVIIDVEPDVTNEKA